jgi:hypothetical protein
MQDRGVQCIDGQVVEQLSMRGRRATNRLVLYQPVSWLHRKERQRPKSRKGKARRVDWGSISAPKVCWSTAWPGCRNKA